MTAVIGDRRGDEVTSVVPLGVDIAAGTRAVCDRIRAIRWQHAIDALIDRGGHKPSQP